MKNSICAIIVCGTFLLLSGTAQAETAQAPIKAISAEGEGNDIGMITFSDTPDGLLINVNMTALPAGSHGMHIHEVGDCGPGIADGKAVAGLAAKGHFDPAHTGAHLGPQGHGHKGDLPYLTVAPDGTAQTTLTAPHLKVSDIRNRSVIIHAGGDNYADSPAKLGGGGERIACGVIQ